MIATLKTVEQSFAPDHRKKLNNKNDDLGGGW
jgi:hypothetical protein